jgi:hypothetical protein
VRDTFGIVSTVPATVATDGTRPRWAMYEVIPAALLVAPSPAEILSGPPLEEVALFRDEMANLVWAVERTTPSALGTPVDRYRYSQPATRVEVNVTDVGDADLVYRLTTPIPTNWIPYLPKRTPAGDDITLERLAGSLPQGAIVSESAVLEDEEVGRTGVVVERAWRYARWTGGQPMLWLGRRVTPGRGEGSSGLRLNCRPPDHNSGYGSHAGPAGGAPSRSTEPSISPYGRSSAWKTSFSFARPNGVRSTTKWWRLGSDSRTSTTSARTASTASPIACSVCWSERLCVAANASISARRASA